MMIWRKKLTQSVNELMNHEAVYRTARATPGLLKMTHNSYFKWIKGKLLNYGWTIELGVNFSFMGEILNYGGTSDLWVHFSIMSKL